MSGPSRCPVHGQQEPCQWRPKSPCCDKHPVTGMGHHPDCKSCWWHRNN